MPSVVDFAWKSKSKNKQITSNMKKLFTIVAMMLLAVMGLSACTAKTNKANGRSSESHQARLNGRVVTDEGEAK